MPRLARSILIVLTASVCLYAAPADVDSAFKRFWAAKDPSDAARAADDVVRSGASFDEVRRRLKQGRPYPEQVPTGTLAGRRPGVQGNFSYTLDVPATYDPARAYTVRIQLHGGVMGREDSTQRGRVGIGRLAGAEQIYIMPAGWKDAPWWSDAQIDNLRAIVDTVKRTYNVDENQIALSGVSDGATGAYYVAMRDTTPYSAFLPLNGSIAVLRNESIGVHGDLFPTNLRNKPFFIVNGGRDPLYPPAAVEPYITHMQKGGVALVYKPQPNAGHDTAWWPDVKDAFESFVREHPRVPLPDRLTWETTDTRVSGRAHWLVIDSLGSRPGDARSMPDLNDFAATPAMEVGMPTPIFRRTTPSGRVDVVRSGNTFGATTRGVSEFTLLLSPDQFDFTQPVKVMTNGRVAFQGRIEPSVATLMKWAARDNDRTMVFGAELKIHP